ncbi:thioredoxin domain-containing protein [Streptomyces buecherae]|uniref:thioredoxin domain-containing protein n=1 Tax=Streptomyces buecherae TaxID=2763006 RepID=UPI001E5E7919|nr:thioredoxin domain-containing protein [Streptomyces buecherae]
MQPGQQQPEGEQPAQGPPSSPPPHAPYPPRPGAPAPQSGAQPPQPDPYAQQGQSGQSGAAAGLPPVGSPAGPVGGAWGPPGAPRPAAGDARRRATLTVVASVAAIALAVTGVLVLGGKGGDGAKDGAGPAAKDGFVGGGDGQGADGATGGVGDTSGGTDGGTGESTDGTGGSGSTGASGGTGGGQRPSGELTKPAHSAGPDGTTVVIGEPKATGTLELYEDLRCPPCAQFEQTIGDTVIEDIKAGRYKARFTMGTFLDESMGGSGSHNALSALGAALDVSPQAFLDYKRALYDERNHPQEGADSFASDAYLLKVAGQVPALGSNSEFQGHVRAGTFDAWAKKMSAAFDASGVPSTPTIKLNGQDLTTDGVNRPATAPEFTKAVDEQL